MVVFFSSLIMKIFYSLDLILFSLCSLHAQESRPDLYPFDVTIGGQKAVMVDGNMLFAVVKDPVKPDAHLELEKKVPMLIINVFACQEDGSVMQAGAQPAILLVQNANAVKLNATMDKKPLTPGRYLANVVANSTTSRVVFVVEDTTGNIKIPSLQQLIDYLNK